MTKTFSFSSGATNLTELWLASSRTHATRPALKLAGKTLTYEDLDTLARCLSRVLHDDAPDSERVGILASRSRTGYAGVIAAVLAGRTYVPLLPDFPAARTATMIDRAGARAVFVGAEAADSLKVLIPLLSDSILWIMECDDASDWRRQFPSHRFIPIGELDELLDDAQVAIPNPSDTAYLLFTSGSTGNPKGVGVSQANVMSYIAFMSEHLQMTPTDRCSQMFELTFDLSVHDLFVTWGAGACLCVPERGAMMLPARYIRDEQLTVWFSVPSVAMVMDKLRTLRSDSFPTLRMSLFCGEALPEALAAKWHVAAPRSVIENLYGPTEATIAITSYQWSSGRNIEAIVPIGQPFPGHDTAIIRPDGSLCRPGETGELALAGPQVTSGYWNDPERTRSAFITLPDDHRTWYRTGDLVQKSDSNELLYKGRIDDQVQVMGFRVELVEVDQALRTALGTSAAIAVSHPPGPSAAAIYAFVASGNNTASEAVLIEKCRATLPAYMVPKRIFFVEELPTNSNGKIDRMKLSHDLENRNLE